MLSEPRLGEAKDIVEAESAYITAERRRDGELTPQHGNRVSSCELRFWKRTAEVAGQPEADTGIARRLLLGSARSWTKRNRITHCGRLFDDGGGSF